MGGRGPSLGPGQSNSSEGWNGEVVEEDQEESEESGLLSVESTNPLESQEAETSMEVGGDNLSLLPSDSADTVSPEEEQMLMGDTTSGGMARLHVSSPECHKSEAGETSQHVFPPADPEPEDGKTSP